MKIAMMTNNYKPFIGGVPISIERLSEGLRELGHEVYIFAPSYDEIGYRNTEEQGVIRYKSLKRRKASKRTYAIPNIIDKDIEKNFMELEIDVIHVHHPVLIGNMALHLGKKYNVPVVFTYHTRYEEYLHNIPGYGVIEKDYKNRESGIIHSIEEEIINLSKKKIVPSYLKNFSNKCDMIIAPTKLMETYLEEVGVTSVIKIIPTGLKGNQFEINSLKIKTIRNRYGKNRRYLFCTVSRLSEEKNIEFIIDGLKRLKDYIGNNFNMLIIGDGPLKKELMKKVNENGLEENIIFLNSIPNEEISNYYGACDLFLFSSKSETQGIVLIEAMAMRVPVVAIEASGVIDVVRNNINGYMTEDNIDDWVEKITLALKSNENMKSLKKGAYETAKQYLNINIAKVAIENYKKLINDEEYICEKRTAVI